MRAEVLIISLPESLPDGAIELFEAVLSQHGILDGPEPPAAIFVADVDAVSM